MRSVYFEFFVISTIISHKFIQGSKNLSEHISPDDNGPKLISIEEWFRKASDPKFDCNQLAETLKIGM